MRVQKYSADIINIGPADEATTKEATNNLLRFGHVLNEHLRGRAYLLGDVLTIADFAVAVTLPYAEKAQIRLESDAG